MVRHRSCLISLCFLALFMPIGGGAASLWNGPTITFVDTPGSDPAQPTNQDRLTTDVWITRGSTAGIYNAATETGFTHSFSPQNTAWSDGALTNYAALSYVDWDTWTKTQHNGPLNTVGVPAVVHLVSEDIYLSVMFTSWEGIGGGFSYLRSTPALTLACQLSANQLELSWPIAGPRLQAQADAFGAGITTNWFDVPGSTTTNHVVVPIDRANGSAFFRLAFP